MGLTELQVTSGYSLLQSTIQIKPLVERASKLGYEHLALTDHSVLHGAISFYRECKKHQIHPIIGMTVEITHHDDTFHVIGLAKNIQGYQHLLAMSTAIHHQGSITWEKWQEENIYTILPVGKDVTDFNQITDLVDQLLDQGSSFYIGISTFDTEKQSLIDYCNLKGIKPVYVSDVRYLEAHDKLPLQSLRAMANDTLLDVDQVEVEGSKLLTSTEVLAAWEQYPDVVENTIELARSCQLEIPLKQQLLPKYPVPSNETADNYLEQICRSQLDEKYPQRTTGVEERLNYELKVIQSMKFSDYFLIVWDFVKFAKEANIMVGPGRGSAAGSLIAYLLDITTVDPIKYDLLFERFLNPERISMPDIDIDFSDEKRDQVIQYVTEKYGTEHVAQIITFGTFAARSLIRELFKVMDIKQEDAAYILKTLPRNATGSIAELVKQSPELVEYIKQSKQLRLLFKIAHRLEGLPRHYSTHAAGVIISDRPLTEYTATLPSNHGTVLTQYDMGDLEAIGLLKMDFLGLRNLTLLERMHRQVKYHYQQTIDFEQDDFMDEKTYALLQRGETNGIFQLESQGMQNVLRELKPTNFEDIVAVNALYRPGPMEFIPQYIARKHKQQPVTYLHEDLKPILEKTNGVLVYQEQIMQIVHQMAGFTLGEADILRRAVSKKEGTIIRSMQQKFITGCTSNGYSREVAEEIFQWIFRFSNYGFNRSHAVAYSVISYQLAYIKANYPLVFYTEILSMNLGNTEKIQMYIREAKQHGIKILPPSINKSVGRFTIEGNAIRVGLGLLKGVGFQAIQELIQLRKQQPFSSLFDFCLRAPLTKINRSMIETFILAGAFDELHHNRATLLASLDEAMEQGELFREFADQLDFFQDDLDLTASYTNVEPFPVIRQLMMEKEIVGFFLSEHPLHEVRNQLRGIGYDTIANQKQPKKPVKLTVAVQSLRVIRTKKGESMAFAEFNDESGEIEAVLFPRTFRQVNHWLKEDMFVYIEGRMEERNDKLQVIVQMMEPFSFAENTADSTSIYIRGKQEIREKVTDVLKTLVIKHPGNATIYFYDETNKKLYKLGDSYKLNSSWYVIDQLKREFGEANVATKQE